jgi:very-short-patch-repair endonuclease
VWFHWDHKTVKERGVQALFRSRMDYLLLLPHGVRVVLEVDGKQHYSHPGGEADPAGYARMVAADRELVLSGYKVFRFGAQELKGEPGRRTIVDFFTLLFKEIGDPSCRRLRR